MIEQFREDIKMGLSLPQKHLPSKYFYDQTGDALFVKIMHLPEYYLTRCELEIFENQSQEIINAFNLEENFHFELIELGPGDGTKTRELLRLLAKHNYSFDYFPVDISNNALDKLQKILQEELPQVSVQARQGDYFEVLESLQDTHHQKVVLFLGSNIGNLDDKTAFEFIYKLGANLKRNDKLLLGLDLIKPKEIVLPAYDDSQGITKAFNLNLLKRINRELGGDFNLNAFYHHAEYDEKEGIAKSYLISTEVQLVRLEENIYYFEKGEKILTEVSRKYNDEIINEILHNTDFRIARKLTDSKEYFASYILQRE